MRGLVVCVMVLVVAGCSNLRVSVALDDGGVELDCRLASKDRVYCQEI